ncbi:hypothetical protein LCGC14_0487480 [marine sediment metagenome]|uniref:Uncharacterized protein n=1 Tax=marine sediment metagenome TaxID=412755 RepID=A0A0F9VGC3_9ZZZZ
MAKPIEFNWTTQERIKSHEEYLRGTRSQPQSLAASLNWTTAVAPDTVIDEEMPDVLDPDVKFPDTLVDDPKDSDDAVDHSDGTKPHDTSAALSFATNWDALLDTAGVPTDGTPPDPLAAQQQQEQLEEQAARQAQMMGRDNGGSQPGITSPQMPSAPASPQVQDKAKQRQRAGRGVEGGLAACGMFVAEACPDGECDNCPCKQGIQAAACGVMLATACPGNGGCGNKVALLRCPDVRGPKNLMPVANRNCPNGSPMPAEGCGDCPGCDEDPTNPMDPGNKYDWDSFSTTPRV